MARRFREIANRIVYHGQSNIDLDLRANFCVPGCRGLKSLPVGTHEITVTYNGSANYEPGDDSITQVIVP